MQPGDPALLPLPRVLRALHPSKYLSQRARGERGRAGDGAGERAGALDGDYLLPAGVAFVPLRV